MFIYCDYCDYDSGDRDTIKELEEKVHTDGGNFSTSIIGADVCPGCQRENTLHVD